MLLIPDDQLRPEEEFKWKKSQTGLMLDLYFDGQASPNRIAQMVGKSPKAVNNKIDKLRQNYKEAAERYEPNRRTSRKGKRWTENENEFIKAQKIQRVPVAITAKILCRDVSEFTEDVTAVAQVNSFKQIAPTLDLVLALRYCRDGYKTKIVSDKALADKEKEEDEFGGGAKALREYHPSYVPQKIKSLALYLMEKAKELNETTSARS